VTATPANPDLRSPKASQGLDENLNILITADPYIPVPPQTYGGIERIIDFLVRGLVDRGHRVTLIAHPASVTPAKLIPFGCPPHVGWKPRLRELWQVGAALFREQRRVDVIHSFGRLAALVPVLPYRRVGKLQTYQRNGIPWRSVRRAVRLAGASIHFTACAAHMFEDSFDGSNSNGRWHAIYNGVDIERFQFVPTVSDDSPLVFLGRIEPIKGVHNAIAVARASDRRLTIAGNRVDTPEGQRYFDERVKPLVDGDQIRYVGPVDDSQKNSLLGSASALLMLIEWDEPFGIVMAEAMACGTPVIGLARGSVPEVVRDGVNGFTCETIEDAVSAVRRLGSVDRTAVRQDCERRFGNGVIVDQYECLYQQVLALATKNGSVQDSWAVSETNAGLPKMRTARAAQERRPL